MRILVTGAAGFIGSAVTRHFVERGHTVCGVTRNTYAAKMQRLADILPQIDLLIGDLAEPYFAAQCAAWGADWVLHLAAETHVDRAIADPTCFVRSNVGGTTHLLHALLEHPPKKCCIYSTDEVFGSTPDGQCFDEQTPYNPSNAYSASKVGVEAMVRAFQVTHHFPALIVRPCNTYGPGQHREKAIPKFVHQALCGRPITLYNTGTGARDWLYIEDHVRAIETLCLSGEPGESYNLAAGDEHSDLEVADAILRALGRDPADICFVPGRPGHDRRYWMNGQKLRALGWAPRIPFTDGLSMTVLWEMDHQDWWAHDEVTYATAC